MQFGEHIRQIRTEKGYTLQYVEEQVGIAKGNLSRYERNLNFPSIEICVNLANFFGCSLDYLIGREDDFGNVNVIVKNDAQPLTEKETKLLELFRKIPTLYQSQVIEYTSYIAEKQKDFTYSNQNR